MQVLRLLRAWSRRLLAAESGASAVEFAIVVLPLFMMIYGALEGGRLLWIQNQVQSAVEVSARCAAIDTTDCGTTAQVQAYAAALVQGETVAATDFTVTDAACGKQVTASVPYTPMLLSMFSMTLSASYCRPN